MALETIYTTSSTPSHSPLVKSRTGLTMGLAKSSVLAPVVFDELVLFHPAWSG